MNRNSTYNTYQDQHQHREHHHQHPSLHDDECARPQLWPLFRLSLMRVMARIWSIRLHRSGVAHHYTSPWIRGSREAARWGTQPTRPRPDRDRSGWGPAILLPTANSNGITNGNTNTHDRLHPQSWCGGAATGWQSFTGGRHEDAPGNTLRTRSRPHTRLRSHIERDPLGDCQRIDPAASTGRIEGTNDEHRCTGSPMNLWKQTKLYTCFHGGGGMTGGDAQ